MRSVFMMVCLSSWFAMGGVYSDKPSLPERPLDFNWLWLKNGKVPKVSYQRAHLVKIISGPEEGRIHRLSLGLEDDGSLKYLIRKSSTDQNIYSKNDFFDKDAVLARASERDALLVRCMGCTASQGGRIRIKYLYNGISMSYKKLDIKISRRGKRWYLLDKRNRKIKTLKLIKREIMGRTIGIDKIIVIYQRVL